MQPTLYATIVMIALLTAGLLSADGADPATMSAATSRAATSTAATLPESALDKLQDMMMRQPTSLEEALKDMEDVIAMGKRVEAEYPNATDLYRAQLVMLEAASFIDRVKRDASSRATVEEIASAILKSSAQAKDKAQADFFLVMGRVTPQSATTATSGPAKEAAAKEIHAFVDKYSKTDAAGRATILGVILATRARLGDLQDELATQLQTKHLDEEGVRGLLRRMGRHPDEGKTFDAELTTLDGKKLSLPKDLLGKVVIVDFWATWCPPCRRTVPLLAEDYGKYKDKGVEIVGISLDKPDQKDLVERYVKENNMTWPQTYSGKYWLDPVAQKYGIEAIPMTWVVGRDGKIAYDGSAVDTPEEMHANLEAAVDKALDAKGSTTASAPASGPAVK